MTQQKKHIVDTNKMMTAVEWLIDQLEKYEDYSKISYRCLGEIEIALEMEKEQIEDAYKSGWDAGDFGSDCWEDIYYNETYGGNKLPKQ